MKIEFSKLILIVAYFTAVFFSGIAAWLAMLGADIASYSNIVLVVWGVVTTGTGFYYWKAKAENVVKITNALPKKLQENIESIKDLID